MGTTVGVAVDGGAGSELYAKQKADFAQKARELAAEIPKFIKDNDALLDKCIEIRGEGARREELLGPTRDFRKNVNALGAVMLNQYKVPLQALQADLFQWGFNLAQGTLPPFVRGTVSALIRQWLSPPSAQSTLPQIATRMISTWNFPIIPPKTKEQVLDALKASGVPPGLHEDTAAAFLDISNSFVKDTNEVKAKVAALDEAFNAAGTPENEKLGYFLLSGYKEGQQEQEASNVRNQLLMDLTRQQKEAEAWGKIKPAPEEFYG